MSNSRPRGGKIYLGALLGFVGYAVRYLYGPNTSQCGSTLGQAAQSLSSSFQQNCSTLQVVSLVGTGLMLLGVLLMLVGVIRAFTWRPPQEQPR